MVMTHVSQGSQNSITFPNSSGIWDQQSSYYEASSSDPAVTTLVVDSPSWCGSGGNSNGGTNCSNIPAHAGGTQTIHIPNGATAGGLGGTNTDGHASILMPDGCIVLDVNNFAHSATNPGAGISNSGTYTGQATMGAGTAGYTDICNGTGFQAAGQGWPGATAGGGSSRLGRSNPAELNTGVIPHALEWVPACNVSTGNTSPTPVGQANYSSAFACGGGGATIAYGSYLWSDVTPQKLATLGLDKATLMLCTALNQYGAVASDINGGYNSISVNGLWNVAATQTTAYLQWMNNNAHGGTPGTANTSPVPSTQPNLCFPATTAGDAYGDLYTGAAGVQNHMHVITKT
jgi:hypothetical protein